MGIVYLAGPITGLSWTDATKWRNDMTRELAPLGIECISPLRGKDFLSNLTNLKDAYPEHSLSTPKGIYTRDRWDAMRCDVLFVNFLGARVVSMGTLLEIGWANAAETPIILVMEEGNVHKHAMVTQCAGYVVETLGEGINILKYLFFKD